MARRITRPPGRARLASVRGRSRCRSGRRAGPRAAARPRSARRARAARRPGRSRRRPRRRRARRRAPTGAGSVRDVGHLAAARAAGGRRPRGEAGGDRRAGCDASSAPSTETPIAPPRVRKNATSELPAPMSRWGTVFCTTSTRFCISIPRPAPSSEHEDASSARLVVSSSVPIRPRPAVSSDAAGEHRALVAAGAGDDPARRASRRGTARRPSGSSAGRTRSGDLPRAICMYWLRKTVVPNIAMPTATLAITASTTVRSRKSAQRDERLGARGARRRPRPTSSARPPSRRARRVCQEIQSYCCPASETQISRLDTPPAISVAPA